MALTRIESDVYVAGNLSALTTTLPSGTVTDAMVNASADIAYTKLEHLFRPCYGQTGTAAAATIPIHHVRGATGTILAVHAGTIAACTGNATITVDVKKNGTTVLSAVITLDNGNTARVAEQGTVSVTSLVAGDLLEVVVAVNAGSGALGTGLFVAVTLAEDAA